MMYTVVLDYTGTNPKTGKKDDYLYMINNYEAKTKKVAIKMARQKFKNEIDSKQWALVAKVYRIK